MKSLKLDKTFVLTFLYRILIYALGLLFLAFSVAFARNSDLGISPVNSLPNAIWLVTSEKLGLGISFGTWVTIVFCFFIVLQIALLRKNFKWYNLFQIAFSTLFGYFSDFAKLALGSFTLPGYIGQLVMLLISIVLIAIGISLYVDTKLIPMPTEGLIQAISDVTKAKFHNVKTISDCCIVLTSTLISIIFLGKLVGVREGTVISALLVGKVIGILQKWIKPAVDKLCFPEAKTEA